MIGPYESKNDGSIRYKGNKVFPPIRNVRDIPISVSEMENRVLSIHDNNHWLSICKINNQINASITDFFAEMDALFIPLPLTTRMISSPGAVYGKEAINYTTDTCPITLKWFDLKDNAFLAESSQIYLELTLLQKGINNVFANYNSFRKENSDFSHLSEFHHIEYEGHVTQEQNLKIIERMLKRIIFDLLRNNESNLRIFLDDKNLKDLECMFNKKIPILKLKDALELLYKDTKEERYTKFTLQNFGSWEEIRLTQIVGGIMGISEMPLLEVPFYHSKKEDIIPLVADNTDIIWPGYRETIGSGHRVKSMKELEEKAKIFNLPIEDYKPYIQSRQFSDYRETSGFGLGWERLLQGLLEMPFIYSASLFPRVHNTLRP